jgi:hypothetical protein
LKVLVFQASALDSDVTGGKVEISNIRNAFRSVKDDVPLEDECIPATSRMHRERVAIVLDRTHSGFQMNNDAHFVELVREPSDDITIETW